VKNVLEAFDKNIQVICHPLMVMKWSHHQKTVIVDQDIAFVGGLDLCFGRYDTRDHCLIDEKAATFPGKDYYNPSKGADIDGLDEPFQDLIDRNSIPRMPWHDVSMRVDGYAARDVAKNFIQRWNHHRNAMQMSSSLLVPKASLLCPPLGSCNCQVLRSLSFWSGQDQEGKTESSIYGAMMFSIANANHFIYIENQYFISSTARGVKNDIGMALLKRIRRAIIEKQSKNKPFPDFRVIVILPIHPEGTYKDSAAIRYIMKWQYDTICRGGKSIIQELTDEFPTEKISDYISFFALRNYGYLQGRVVTEEVYVHAKLMIVDDRIAIIGSANINDRSLLGDRDSEIAILTEDQDLTPSKMGGNPFMAGKFALALRMHLWREHLGLDVNNSNRIMDPIIPESYEELWGATAISNTKHFDTIFGGNLEDNQVSVREVFKKPNPEITEEIQAQLSLIKGHLVEYPLKFLLEGLNASVADLDILVAGDEVFQ